MGTETSYPDRDRMPADIRDAYDARQVLLAELVDAAVLDGRVNSTPYVTDQAIRDRYTAAREAFDKADDELSSEIAIRDLALGW